MYLIMERYNHAKCVLALSYLLA